MTQQPKKIMFYVQHLLGIGHLARASAICRQLVLNGCEVKMVMGGAPVKGFPHPSIEVLQLPVLKAGTIEFNALTDNEGVVVDVDYLNTRRDLLLSLFESFQPDVLVIEAFPFGRRQMRFELLPLLDLATKTSHKTTVAGSVRDIVQEKKNPKRNIETVDTLKKYFDILMVHGDPQFAKLDETFNLASEIQDLIEYTGIVCGEVSELSGEIFDVVVSAGGGVAGQTIMLNALKAKPLSKLANARWCFLIGPNMLPASRKELERENDGSVTMQASRSDFRALLGNAKLSISQAGYNTTADILQAKCASVLVPYAEGGETEQTFRAQRLASAGLASMVTEEQISPQVLATAIDQCTVMSKNAELDMNGAERSAQLLA